MNDAVLTHLDSLGRARRVDVSNKPVSFREALDDGDEVAFFPTLTGG